MKNSSKQTPPRKQYPTWLSFVLFIGKMLVKFEPSTLLKFGKKLGWLLQKCLTSHHKNTVINLKLCFPKESEQFREKLANQYFESFGMSLLELCMAGFATDHQLPPCKVKGFEEVQNLIQDNRPIVFVSAHFSTMLLMGRFMARLFPFSAVFRLQRQKLFNSLVTDYASGYGVSLIPPKLSSMVKNLGKGRMLYFIDQDHGLKHSLFAPFFGVETATIKALPLLAKASGAMIVPVFCYRQLDPLQYELIFLPPVVNYPNTDPYQNACHINQILEAAIRKQPELNFWYYKRFRTRPEGMLNPYEKPRV